VKFYLRLERSRQRYAEGAGLDSIEMRAKFDNVIWRVKVALEVIPLYMMYRCIWCIWYRFSRSASDVWFKTTCAPCGFFVEVQPEEFLEASCA